MRENWTYKKLGEVCEIEYGTRVVQARDGGSIYPVYGGGGATFMMDTYNRENRVVVSRFAMSKKCTRKVIGKFFLNDSGLTIKSKGPLLLQNYLDTFILSSNDKIYHLGRGLAQKNLKVPDLLQIDIAIPNAEVQQSIVSELDKINELISLKKAQLSDLDALAQSIFYDMFGDPIENEKGWEKKKYEDICLIITDGEHSTPKRESNGIFLLSARNIHNHRLELQDVDYIGEDEYNRVSKRIIPQAKDILISCSGSVGRVCSVPDDIKFQMVRSVALLRLKSHMNNVFFEYLISSDFTQEQITKAKTNSAQANLFQGRIKNLIAIVPPLSLQQDFAKRIELIEQQKVQISSTIKDLETLLASRMQYWFD